MSKTHEKNKKTESNVQIRRFASGRLKIGKTDFIEGVNCFKLKKDFNKKTVTRKKIGLHGVFLSSIHLLAFDSSEFYFINSFTGSIIQIADRQKIRLNDNNESHFKEFALKYFNIEKSRINELFKEGNQEQKRG